eukprot:1146695-Pelagomonas_calceolata.AAC.6
MGAGRKLLHGGLKCQGICGLPERKLLNGRGGLQRQETCGPPERKLLNRSSGLQCQGTCGSPWGQRGDV